VRVPDQRDGATVEQGCDAGQHPVEPFAHLRGGLPAGAAVGPDVPVRIVVVDVDGGAALVLAVVPLAEVLVDGVDGEPGQLRGAQRPGAGAGQHGDEAPAGQERGQGAGLSLAVGGQLQVRVRGVPQAGAPGGLAVPDQQELSHAVS
jgi:hypothetical protein